MAVTHRNSRLRAALVPAICDHCGADVNVLPESSECPLCGGFVHQLPALPAGPAIAPRPADVDYWADHRARFGW